MCATDSQKKKLVIALALLGEPKILLLDECFAALDVLTIQMLQKIIVSLQTEDRIGIIICDHQAFSTGITVFHKLLVNPPPYRTDAPCFRYRIGTCVPVKIGIDMLQVGNHRIF